MRAKDSRVYLIKSETDLNRLYDDIEKALVDSEIEVCWSEYVPKRSLAQNRLLWAYYTDIGKQIGQHPEDCHLYYRAKFLPVEHKKIFEGAFNALASTTKLNMKDFADYLMKIEVHAAENGLTLYAPHYRELALYGEKGCPKKNVLQKC